MLDAAINHLLQSTLFAGVAGLLSLALRGSRARARYWVWLAASIKFLVPFSLLINIGSYFAPRVTAAISTPRWVVVMEEIRRPMTVPSSAGVQTAGMILPSWGAIAAIVWLCGLITVLAGWWLRTRRLREVVSGAVPIESGCALETLRRLEPSYGFEGIQLRSCDSPLEPGVFGIFKPILLLPSGIGKCLDDAQLEAIVAHELCHIRNRDNLLASLQMAIEAIFWFHPLVWWLGARMVEEGERACDEEVLRTGREPEIYAESILKVCRFYLESPVVCVSGVTGADLKKRIEGIMSHRPVRTIGFAKRALLTATAFSTVAVPLAIGMMTPREIDTELSTLATGTKGFEEVTIRPGQNGSHRVQIRTEASGRFSTSNASVRSLVAFAYNLRDHQITGGPEWLDTERYDIAAKSGPTPRIDEVRAMMRKLLQERFKLSVSRDVKVMPIFELSTVEGGPKFQSVKADGHKQLANVWIGRGRVMAPSVAMPELARILSGQLGRAVEDRTGLRGSYAVNLTWAPDGNHPVLPGLKLPNEPPPADPNGPPLELAIRDQLGLQLEPATGPVETFVIQHAEKIRF